MRVIPMLAGLAMAVAACGGEKKADQQTAAPETAAPAPAATGAAHDVDMVLDGSTYKFVPADITIKSGDVIRFHNKSGFPHNVSFWADSIPAGAAAALTAGMPNPMAPLQSPLLTQQDEVYSVTFANAPAGEYKMYCLPHLAFGMHGKVTVQ